MFVVYIKLLYLIRKIFIGERTRGPISWLKAAQRGGKREKGAQSAGKVNFFNKKYLLMCVFDA